jgi:hypothetical protein
MTTIAYRDGVLAADTSTYIQDGNLRLPGRVSKIRRLPDGSLYSGAGTVSQIEALRIWLISERAGEKPKTDEVTALHVRPDGTVLVYDGAAEREMREAPFYAAGTGAAAALGAMMAGASAPEAIRIAIALDPYTSGEVDVLALAGPQSLA